MSGAYIGKENNKNNRRSKGGLNSDRPVMLSEIVAIIQELSSGGTGFLKADGSIPMTGLLTLSGDPVNNLNPVTKQFLVAALAALVNSAPTNLDTLGEIAAALGNDPNFASNLASQLTGINNDITNIKNYEFKVLYYASINSATGTIAKPTNTDIILNDFPQGYDAVVETIINGEPTGEIAKTAGGAAITVSSFDINGNYTLSGTPSAFPVALLYVLKVKNQYMSNLNFDNIIEAQNLSATQASNVTFTPNGDIAATNVQSAIVEVRDDTDTKLALKLDKASNLSDLANAGTARTNLGLGNSAVLDIGTSAGTVRAGDDLRFKDISSYKKTGTVTLERWYSNAVGGYAPTAAPYAGNILRGIPVVISVNQSWDRIGLEVTTIGSAGSVIRLGLYSNNNIIPENLIADYGTIPGDSIGIQTITISQTLTPGLYFIALNHNSTTNIFIRSVSNDACPPVLGLPATFGTILSANSITSNLTYTTMPSTFTTSGMAASAASYTPDIRVRLSSI